MTTEATATARRNTRLTPEREMELYTAVVELLREVGYEALTMDAVATRTRSSKATLYRQWKGKPELVATALRACKPVRAEEVDTGSIATDLYEMARGVPEQEDQDAAAVMRALAHAATHNPDLGNALREALIEPEMAALRRMLDRAVERARSRRAYRDRLHDLHDDRRVLRPPADRGPGRRSRVPQEVHRRGRAPRSGGHRPAAGQSLTVLLGWYSRSA